ncbi:MAG: hypothetical protein HYY40_05460 [Bacteroidetes bacterium]|nr:hypothetical protein [Bacteroidota bacterium]
MAIYEKTEEQNKYKYRLKEIPLYGSTMLGEYKPNVLVKEVAISNGSVSNTYPFGMLQVGRNFNAGQSRFGYNGKEMDNEVYGTGNIYDYGFRLYDPRKVVPISPDILARNYPWQSPYTHAGNNPIWAVDLLGAQAKLAIWGSGAGDESAFHARAIRFASSTNVGYTTVHGITSGKDFVDILRTKTNEEGSIASFVIFSHAFAGGVILEPSQGFYTSTTGLGSGINSRDIDDIVAAVESGEIRFEDNAISIFGGCNCAGYGNENDNTALAREFTQKTGVTSIASVGSVSPEIIGGKETGRLVSDVQFFRIERTESGELITQKLGKIIDPTEFNVDITIPSMEPRPLQLIPVGEPEALPLTR